MPTIPVIPWGTSSISSMVEEVGFITCMFSLLMMVQKNNTVGLVLIVRI